MSSFRFCFSVFLTSVLSVTPFMSIEAQDTVQVITTNQPRMIITPVPDPKEVVVEPAGYVSCATVEAGWYQNEWHPAHRVCTYTTGTNPAIQGTNWIEAHWACSQYKITGDQQGECSDWEWKPGRWTNDADQY